MTAMTMEAGMMPTREVDANRKVLLNVAQTARAARKISALEFLRIRRVCQPRVWNRLDVDAQQTIGEQIEAFVAEQAVTAGAVTVVAGVAAVDWDNLLEFLQGLLPLILEFIEALMLLF